MGTPGTDSLPPSSASGGCSYKGGEIKVFPDFPFPRQLPQKTGDHFQRLLQMQRQHFRLPVASVQLNGCMRFTHRQGFGSGWDAGVASVRRCQKLLLCRTEPVPAGSKEDLLPTKAEPISATGSAQFQHHCALCCLLNLKD